MSVNEAPQEKIRLFTMKELHKNTEEIIKEINESGETAFITSNGRIVGKIEPLAHKENPEARLLWHVLSDDKTP